MTPEIKAFTDAAMRVLEQLDIMIESERDKRQALLDRDGDKLERLLQSQQAMVMKLEGFEKKRVAAQQVAGLGGMNRSEILERAGENKPQLEEVFDHLTAAAAELKELNSISLEIANSELRFIRQLMVSAQSGGGLYGADGRKGTGKHTGASLEEKI